MCVVPSQEVLTRDSVTIQVNAVVYYRINDPIKSVLNVEDVNVSTHLLGQVRLFCSFCEVFITTSRRCAM